MHETPPPPPPAPPRKIVYLPRARCPACHSIRLTTYKSITQPDGAVCRYTRCNACGHRFTVLLE